MIHFHAPLSSQPEASTSTLTSTSPSNGKTPLNPNPDLPNGPRPPPTPTSSSSDQDNPDSILSPPPLPFNPTLTRHLLPSTTPLLPPPTKLDSLPTNSLNFCKFALVEIPGGAKGSEGVKRGRRRVLDGLVGLDRVRGEGEGEEGRKEGLLAVPNLMDSDSVSL